MHKITHLLYLALFFMNWNIAIAKEKANFKAGPAPNSSNFSVGGTYDSMSQHSTSTISCLTAAANPANLDFSQPVAKLDFTQLQTSAMVQRALGVEFTAQFGYGPFSVSTSYNYARSSQDDDYTLNLNYIYQYTGKLGFKNSALLDGDHLLIPAARAILGSPNQFRQMCGDSYVAQLDAGASLLVRLSLSFNSITEKNYFDESFSKIGGLQNILAIIKSNPNNVHYHLNSAAIQVGGDPILLNELFIHNGGSLGKDTYPILDCGNEFSTESKCANLINQIIIYSQTLSKQLNSSKDYYLMNPTPASWSTIGIEPVAASPDPAVNYAMQQLTEQYNQDYQDLHFIANYRNMLLSKDLLSSTMQQNLDKLIITYQNLMSIYSDPNSDLMDCFNGFIGNICLTVRDKVFNRRNSILADNGLAQLLSYLKSNQYLVTIITSPTLDSSTQCMLSPISSNDIHLFMLNCNEQFDGSFESDLGISLIQAFDGSTLTIDNFSFNYRLAGMSSRFTYYFDQPLQTDSLDHNLYAGVAAIHNSDSGTLLLQNVFFTKLY